MNDTHEIDQHFEIFYPNAHGQISKLNRENKNPRFVHYTSATSAISIIENQELWMRNAACMNDYQEIHYGIDCVKFAFKTETGKNFENILDRIHNGISKEILRKFNNFSYSLPNETYIFSLSKHLREEDDFGRLSMWRAYGADIRVALLFKTAPFLDQADTLRAYTSPVAYLNKNNFLHEFAKVTKSIDNNQDFIRHMSPDAVIDTVFQVLWYAAMCTKHPGFKEEKEWRIIHNPSIDPSKHLIKQVTTIKGAPQIIYKIPLKNIPSEGLTGIEVPEILDKIIIGPTTNPKMAYDAFVEVLQRANITDAMKKVIVSDIPLRD